MRNFAVLNKKNCEENPRNNLAQNTIVPRSQEDYIIQASEEIDCRLTKKLFKEFNGTESRFLGAFSQLHEFLLNPLIEGHSGSAPETSRKALNPNQGTNEDDSQSNPHPEARGSQS